MSLAKMFILAVLLAVLSTTAVFGQGSGRAVMRVSVEIVQGPSVALNSPAIVGPVLGRVYRLGSLTLARMEPNRILVKISNEIVLKSSDGKEVKMDIRSRKKRLGHHEIRIFLLGYWGRQSSPRSYRGQIETTIEYF